MARYCDDQRVTAVIATVGRNAARIANLRTLVLALNASSVVSDVLVLWNAADAPPRNLTSYLTDARPGWKVGLETVRTSSLNHRYAIPLRRSNACSFFVFDDDHVVQKDGALGKMMSAWQTSRPSPSLLGFKVRGNVNNSYRTDRGMNYVLPPFLVSRRLCDVYSSRRFAELRRYVDEQAAHCDDLLLNLVASEEKLVVQRAAVTGITGVRLGDGVSDQDNRTVLRTECMRHLEAGVAALGGGVFPPYVVDGGRKGLGGA